MLRDSMTLEGNKLPFFAVAKCSSRDPEFSTQMTSEHWPENDFPLILRVFWSSYPYFESRKMAAPKKKSILDLICAHVCARARVCVCVFACVSEHALDYVSVSNLYLFQRNRLRSMQSNEIYDCDRQASKSKTDMYVCECVASSTTHLLLLLLLIIIFLRDGIWLCKGVCFG